MGLEFETRLSEDSMDLCIGGRFSLGGHTGAGSFGTVFEGLDQHNGCEVAIKMEPLSARMPQLQYESRLYKALGGREGIPKMHWYGVHGGNKVLVLERMGKNLEGLFNARGRNLSLKTVCMLGEQMINRIEHVHNKGFLHRDVKPENFVMGRGDKRGIVNLIDFGLAKKFVDPKTKEHIPYREGKPFLGTLRYASINCHLGIEQSRRDDLEAIGYMLVYFMKGRLPWQGLVDSPTKSRHEKIKEKKMSTSLESLCKGLPSEFINFISYVRNLHFHDQPNYSYLKLLLRNCVVNAGLEYDADFDESERWENSCRRSRVEGAALKTPLLSKESDSTLERTTAPEDAMHSSSGTGADSIALAGRS